MADDTRLARVETAISKHRSLYLRATWAGHLGEADYHETEVDRLILFWSHVRDGWSYTLTEFETELAGPVRVVSRLTERP